MEIRQVEIVGASGQFTLAQLEIFSTVTEAAIDAAGMVEFPIPAHGLKGLRQCAHIVVGVTGCIGQVVEIVVKSGISTFDIWQGIVEKFLPVV